ncbi:muts domain V-domain-containing protein [Flagelloscypha sp. PMI_526]|nr:muts domain V-domain-containing protein [Flagelloscypha sp. PMI_526]
MAPPSTTKPKVKTQKSIESFFGTKSSAPKPKPAAKKETKDATAAKPTTPERVATSSSAAGSSSSYGSSPIVHDTPPTSDVIDVDMDSEDGKVAQPKLIGKRKVMVDSDDDLPPPSSSSRAPTASPREPDRRARVKKPRLSVPLSDSDDEMPVRKLSRRKSRSDDEDDFIVRSDSDSDAEMKSVSSRSSSHSRRSSSEQDEDTSDDDDAPRKSKAKSRAKAAPRPSTGGGNKSFSFLTAAEERRQAKKDDKKSGEDPFSFLIDIKDKDGKSPGDPQYDPRTLFIPKGAWKTFTPFEKQFWEIKQDHYDTILFFQKGKFFELYEDDARIGHQEFDLKMTSRVKMSMVGVPEMAFEFWAAKFLAKGYKVGKVEQSETQLGKEMRVSADKKKGTNVPQKSDIVQRELNKVYTNGTLVDPKLLTDDEAGHCVCIRESFNADAPESPSTFGVCVLDCATSQFDLSTFEDDVCRTKLETLMRQIRPKEFIHTKGQLSVTTMRLLKAVLPPTCMWTNLREVEGFAYKQTLQELRTIYNEAETGEAMMDDEDGSGLPSSVPESIRQMASSETAIEALGSMLWYLRQLNIDKDIMSMKNFNVYDPIKKGKGLSLDGQTLAHIEVLMNSEGNDEGTLLKLLNRCLTPFGKRLFRIWLCSPLTDIKDINARLDAVEDIEGSAEFQKEFKEAVKKLPDLERIVARVHAKNCKVKDFLEVLKSFRNLSKGLERLASEAESLNSKSVVGLLRGAPELLPYITNVEEMFKPVTDEKSEDLLPRKGKFDEFDASIKTMKSIENDLDKKLEEINNRVDFECEWWHNHVGNKDIYMVETSASVSVKKIPADWKKHNSTKNKARYSVPSLQSTVRKLKEARETHNGLIKTFKFKVYEEFDRDKATWLRAIRVLAELDCLYSLAMASSVLPEPKCRPEFVESETGLIDFEDLKHPTLALTSTKDFIPNTVQLGGEFGKIALLTGPNMAGKSTLMRMTAAGVILAQLGMKVPAVRARLCPVDSILTRMGAYDNMFTASSTFKVELDECCKILRDATPKSLVILDELGRGTSTYDGMAIASAVLHELATHTLSLSFFATHYGSLTSDYMNHPNIRNMHMATQVNEDEREIVFLFKLIDGAATSSFGTYVGKVAGVPDEVVARAEVVSKSFAKQFKEKQLARRQNDSAARVPVHAQADFAYLFKLGTEAMKLPDDQIRRKEVLKRLKTAMRAVLAQASENT